MSDLEAIQYYYNGIFNFGDAIDVLEKNGHANQEAIDLLDETVRAFNHRKADRLN